MRSTAASLALGFCLACGTRPPGPGDGGLADSGHDAGNTDGGGLTADAGHDAGAPDGGRTPWITGWYAGWLQNDLPPSAIDYEVVTHVIHFAVFPNADGSLQVSNRPGFDSPATIAGVVNTVHAAGRKVLVTVGGAGTYDEYKSAILPANRSSFISNIVSLVTTHDYDGIDVDMEPVNPADEGAFRQFVTELRNALDARNPQLMLTVAAGPAGAICQVHQALDQINIMTYDMAGAWPGWIVWHNSPVLNGGEVFPSAPSRQLPSADLYAQEFINAGCPKEKLAIGLDFYGYEWAGGAGTDTGGVTRPRQGWTTAPAVSANIPYYELFRTFDLTQYKWDSVAKAAYLSIDKVGSTDDKFVSFDNEETAQAKVAYVRQKGLGGLAIWELAGGYLKTRPAGQRDPLVGAIKQALKSP